MIELRQDCLFLDSGNGVSIPCTAEAISIELAGNLANAINPELVRQAAAAVLHHFKADLGKTAVTVQEFASALEGVLHQMGLGKDVAAPAVARIDLLELAAACGGEYELGFFVRVRASIKQQLTDGSHIIHFSGLQSCVKTLVGARRWSSRCTEMEDQIVEFMRDCFAQENVRKEGRMLVL